RGLTPTVSGVAPPESDHPEARLALLDRFPLPVSWLATSGAPRERESETSRAPATHALRLLGPGGHPELLGVGGIRLGVLEEIPSVLARLAESQGAFQRGIWADGIDELAQKYVDCVRLAGNPG